MLDQNDLAAIRAIMKEEIAESEKKIESIIDERLTESENLILEEMERTRKTLDDRISQVQRNLDELEKKSA